MSRTIKDKPYSLVHKGYWLQDRVPVDGGHGYRETKTTKPKKRKEVDTEDHWISSTPGWWVKMMMTKPERRNAHLLEKKVLRTEDIDDVDFPDLGRKPHTYFY